MAGEVKPLFCLIVYVAKLHKFLYNTFMKHQKKIKKNANQIIEKHKPKKVILTISKKEEKVLKDFKEQLVGKLKDEVVFIQLFGSKARGDFHKDSDIDILVVLKNPAEDQINFIYDTVIFLSCRCNVYLSVKIFSEKEFNYYKSIPTRFIRNVLKEGVLL